MKKIFAALLLMPALAWGQLTEKSRTTEVTIGKVEAAGILKFELYKIIDLDNEDSVTVLMFRNQKYEAINDYKSVSYLDDAGLTTEQLYNLLSSVFTNESFANKDFSKSVKLGKDDLFISRLGGAGVPQCYVSVKNKGYFTISRSQLDKLFGKKR